MKNVLQSGVSHYDIATILAAHNRLRNAIASGNETRKGFPSSANMVQLEWDQELAAISQSHASQCQFQHDFYECRRTGISDPKDSIIKLLIKCIAEKYTTVGQNLFLYRTSRTTVRQRWQHTIQLWYEELDIAPKSIVQQFMASRLNIGHFTQVS
jgi:hypothetical protein